MIVAPDAIRLSILSPTSGQRGLNADVIPWRGLQTVQDDHE
jgi:hypothetical protein